MSDQNSDPPEIEPEKIDPEVVDPEDIDPEDEKYLREIGYRANVNQVRHEPMPASTYAERDQEAVRRNEEAAAESAKVLSWPGSRTHPSPEQEGDVWPSAERRAGEHDESDRAE
jgi:hypothetical protein